MLDVHMLQLDGAKQEWRDQALSTIPPNVALHIVPGVPGDTRRLRLEAMLLGSEPYSTYVDEDDWLTAGAVEAVVERLRETRPRYGLVTKERVWDYFTQTTYVRGSHALLVMHKDQVKAMLDRPDIPQYYLKGWPRNRAMQHMDLVAYNWRRYVSPEYLKRLADGFEPDLRNRQIDLDTPLGEFRSV